MKLILLFGLHLAAAFSIDLKFILNLIYKILTGNQDYDIFFMHFSHLNLHFTEQLTFTLQASHFYPYDGKILFDNFRIK